MKNIFYVEDDKETALIIEKTLENGSFKSMGFLTGIEFLHFLEYDKPDLILLDLMLPDMSGFDVLKILRSNSQTNEIPIIVLSALNSEVDKLKAFDLGADDYMTKPFGLLELLSKIKQRLKYLPKKEKLKMGNLVMDLKTRQVFISEEEVYFTYKEFKILMLLVKNPNKALSREKILKHVWKSELVLESITIDMHIKVIRQKLKDNNATVKIKTVRSVGYRVVDV